MAQDKAYREAEAKIAEALRTGATELDLSHRYDAKDSEKLTELPESLSQLKRLHTLDLSHNQLTALTESLGQLTELQTLNTYGSPLNALPESQGWLTLLVELQLGANQLTSLPKRSLSRQSARAFPKSAALSAKRSTRSFRCRSRPRHSFRWTSSLKS